MDPSAAQSGEALPLVQRRPIATLLGCVAVGLMISWALQAMGPGAVELGRTPVFEAVVDDAGTPGVRPVHADVTLVAFTDYRCGVCKASERVLQQRLAHDGRIRVLYKDWPILGEESRQSARVALAAGYQGKYAAIHNAFMAATGRLDPVGMRRASDAAGVDWPRLQGDLQVHAGEIDATLRRNNLQAWSLGLEGTPAYLIGPFLLKGKLTDYRLSTKLAAARRRG